MENVMIRLLNGIIILNIDMILVTGASKKTAKLEACKSITEALEAGTLKMPEGRGSVSYHIINIILTC